MSARILPFATREEADMATTDDPIASPEETAAWRELDVEDTAAFDEAHFDELAASIEQSVDAETVVPFRPRLAVAVLLAALLLLGMSLLLRSDPLPEPGALADRAPEQLQLDDASLEDAARAVGRAAVTTLFDDEIDGERFASADWLLVDDDELSGSYTSLLEEFDELPGSELNTLLTPL